VLKRKIKKIIVLIVLLASSGVFFSFCDAAPDKEINYQGKLTNDSDVAVADGNYSFKLTLYDAVSGGNCVWTSRGTCGTPTAKTIAVENGIFSTKLGESGDNAITLDFSSNYYLGVTIGGDSEMTPRKKIGVTGFAINSDLLDGLDSAESGTDAHIVKTDASGDITTSADLNFGTDVSLRRGGADRLDLSSGDSLNLVSGSIQMAGTSIVTSSRVLQNITQATIDNIRLDGNTISATNDSGLYLYDNASNGIFIQDGGNVGIGTTVPTEKLGINISEDTAYTTSAQPSVDAAMVLYNTTNTDVDKAVGIGFYVERLTSQTSVGGIYGVALADNSLDFAFKQENSGTVGETMRITSAGNIGIGTTAPGATLSINTEGGASASGAEVLIVGDAATSDQFLELQDSAGKAMSLFYQDSDGDSQFALYETTGTTQNVFVSAGGNSYFNGGNVGIGTTTPSYKLDVQGGYVNASSGLCIDGDCQTTWTNVALPPGTTGQTLYNSSGTWTSTSNLYHNGTNVGIGTTAPAAPLHIKSGALSGYKADYIKMYSPDYPSYYGVLRFEASGATSGLGFSAGSATTQMFLNTSGNVGIGTTGPDTKLNIAGTIHQGTTDTDLTETDRNIMENNLFFYVDGATSNTPSIAFREGVDNIDASIFLDGTTDALTFTTDQTASAMVIQTDGNVGIGTTEPAGKLDITIPYTKTDTSARSVAYIGKSNEAEDYSALQMYMKGAATAADRYWVFQTIEESVANAGSIVFQPSGGNVGIGTTAPSGKLEIDGGDLIMTGTATNHLVLPSIYDATTPTLAFGDGDTGFFEASDNTIGIAHSGSHFWTFSNQLMGSRFSTEGGIINEVPSTINPNYLPVVSDETTGIGGAEGTIDLIVGGVSGLHVDNNGNIGIGTTAPGSYKLNVYGGSSSFNPDADSQLIIKNAGTNATMVSAGAGDGLYIGGGDTYQIYMASADSSVKIKDGVDLLVGTGNVGIGTTAPGAKLEVKGGAIKQTRTSSGNQFSIAGWDTSLGASTNQIIFKPAKDAGYGSDGYNTVLEQQTGADRLFYFRTSGVGTLGIDVDGQGIFGGNVGIGTTAPGALLTVGNNAFQVNSVGQVGVSGAIITDSALATRQTSSLTALKILGRASDNAASISFRDSGDTVTKGTINTDNTGMSLWGAMKILSTGNVGIGTTGPGATLDINGKTKTTTFQMTSGASAGYFLTSDGSGNSSWADVSSSAGPWTLSGSNLYPDSTSYNVGIGTTGTSNKLEVDGGSAETRLRISTTGTDTREAGIILANSSKSAFNDGIEISHGGGLTYFDDLAGEQQMMIDMSNSRVVIGTGSAASKLSVNGSISAGTYSATAAPTNGMIISGNVGIGTTAPSSPDGIEKILEIESVNHVGIVLHETESSGTPWEIYVNGQDLRFVHNTADRLLIDQDGNVGIGTTGPGEKLEVDHGVVVSDSESLIRLSIDTGSGTTNTSNGIMFNTRDTVPGRGGSIIVNGMTSYGQTPQMEFRLDNTIQDTKMTILNTGNVGIGTMAPGASLDVQGGDGVIGIRLLGSEGKTSIDWLDGGANDPGYTRWYNANAVVAQVGQGGTYFNTGNVGIGTTAPGTPLHIVGSGASVLRLKGPYDATSSQAIEFSESNGAAEVVVGKIGGIATTYTVGNETAGLNFFTINGGSLTEKMRITSAGNVGIGTTAPTELLSLYGNAKYLSIDRPSDISYNGIKFEEAGVDQATILMIGSNHSTVARRGDLEINSDNGDVVLQPSTGNVGIGTTSSAYKMHMDVGAGGYYGLDFNAGAYGGLMIREASTPVAYLQYRTDTTPDRWDWAAGGSTKVVLDENGNVGIGMTAPSAPLTIQSGNSGNNPVLQLTGTNTLALEFQDMGQAVDSRLWQMNVNSGLFFFRSFNDARSSFTNILTTTRGGDVNIPNGKLTVSGTGDTTIVGNVGIGTTSPEAKLHIVGSTILEGTFGNVFTDGNEPYFFASTNSDSAEVKLISYNTVISADEEIGQLSFNISPDNTNVYPFSSIRSFIDGTVGGATDLPSRLSFYTIPDGSDVQQERMTIKNTGNVGIGTTAPTSKLSILESDTVAGTARTAMFLDYDLSGADVLAADIYHIGLQIDLDSSATGGDTTNEHRIYGIDNAVDVTGDSDLVYGINNIVRVNQSAGTITNLAGQYTYVQGDNSGGTITNLYGTRSLAYEELAGTRTTVYGNYIKVLKQATAVNITTAQNGLYSELESDAGAGVITTGYAVRAEIDNDTSSASAWGTSYLYYGNYAGTLPTNAYGVYIPDAVSNYFNGNIDVNGVVLIDASGIRLDAGIDGYVMQVNGDSNDGLFYDVSTNAFDFMEDGVERGYVDLDNGNLQMDGSVSVGTTLDMTAGNINNIGDLVNVDSTNKVANLNADLLDGFDSSAFGDATLAMQNSIYAKVDNAYSACYTVGLQDWKCDSSTYTACVSGWTSVTTFTTYGMYDATYEDHCNDWRVCCLAR
jgi:hypothetical protein